MNDDVEYKLNTQFPENELQYRQTMILLGTIIKLKRKERGWGRDINWIKSHMNW